THGTTPQAKRTQRKVAFATVIGTTIEWYDYFTYSTAAALVFEFHRCTEDHAAAGLHGGGINDLGCGQLALYLGNA
ncbi:UNVERIFIED_CONTAM: hypothetical protein IGO34_37535, partial [Salmonella enterica subsp. enterica serovar Weltevreden]